MPGLQKFLREPIDEVPGLSDRARKWRNQSTGERTRDETEWSHEFA